jgi:hypothetical protein
MNKALFRSTWYLLSITLLIVAPSLTAIDNAHWYRAPDFLPPIYEPRFTTCGLFSFDCFISHGTSHKAFGSSCENRVHPCGTPLLNVYGLHNMHMLGAGVPNKDPQNPLDLALINLEGIPARENFGKLLFSGKFSVTEAQMIITQNFIYGVYAQVHIPVRKVSINNISFCDASPTDTNFPNINTPEWQTFLSLFPEILARYDLSVGSISQSGIGDVSFMLGWSYHYEKTHIIDFLDLSIAVGLLVPSGKKKNEDKAFSLALGYNDHLGVPVHANLAFGSYGWLDVGMHVYAMPFDSKIRTIRLKTDPAQNGFITLAKGDARITPGTLYGISAYVKADHVLGGLSLTLAYMYDKQNKDNIIPCNTNVFNTQTLCTDRLYKGWRMHTISVLAEYDCTTQEQPYMPRITGFVNIPIDGRRIFKTTTGGVGVGIDYAW